MANVGDSLRRLCSLQHRIYNLLGLYLRDRAARRPTLSVGNALGDRVLTGGGSTPRRWRSHTSVLCKGRTHPLSGKYIWFWYVISRCYGPRHCSFSHAGGMICHDVFDCTADLAGQLNGNRQKGTLQIDAPPVENFWLRHCGEAGEGWHGPQNRG